MAGRKGARTYKPRINDSPLTKSTNDGELDETVKDSQSNLLSTMNIRTETIEVKEETTVESNEENIKDEELEEVIELEQENKSDEEIELDEISKEIQRDIQEQLEKERQVTERVSNDEDLPEVNIFSTGKLQEVYEANERIAKAKLEESSKSNDTNIPHYTLQRNRRTGSVEIVNPNQKSEVKENMSQKIEIAKSMLASTEHEIIKNQIEIEIHSEILKKQYDPNEIVNIQRKIDTFSKNMDYLEQRKTALKQIIGVQ